MVEIDETLFGVLKMAEAQRLWKTRTAASEHYDDFVIQIKRLLREGLLEVFAPVACVKQYHLSDAGKAALEAERAKCREADKVGADCRFYGRTCNGCSLHSHQY